MSYNCYSPAIHTPVIQTYSDPPLVSTCLGGFAPCLYRTHHLLLLWAFLAWLAAELAEPLLPATQSSLLNVELPGEAQGKGKSCIAPSDCERGSSLGSTRGETVGMEVHQTISPSRVDHTTAHFAYRPTNLPNYNYLGCIDSFIWKLKM